MKRSARNVRPSMSHDAKDKLLAALNWSYGNLKGKATYDRAPMYFDACGEWYERLSEDDLETLADMVASALKAEGMAASLPPAPRCPL